MFIKMLIVDDEPIISRGLVTTISWEGLGVKVAGIAYNGKEALEFIEKEKVDLILTDISMPEMDGLEMAEYISNDYPETKIIMLSGYDNFEYAKKAIRIGVQDYLLKPVDIDELINLIVKVRVEIIKERESQVLHEKELIYHALLHSLFNTPHSLELKKQINNVTVHYRLLISEINNYYNLLQTYSSQELNALKVSWKEYIDHVLSYCEIKSISIFSHENQLLTICYTNDTEKLEVLNFNSVCKSFSNEWEHPLLIGVSSLRNELSFFPELFDELSAALSHRRANEMVLFAEDGLKEETGIIYPPKEELQLKKVIENKEKEKVKTIIHSMFDRFQKMDFSLQQVLHICQNLVSTLKKHMIETNPNYKIDNINLLSEDQNILRIYNTLDAIKQIVLTELEFLMSSLKDKENNHWIIQNVKKYINDNYQKDIKASVVAENNYITPSYFSVLFKQETGQSFSEYLNSLRIKKASELLLNTPHKVFEIAEYVGYKEYKYFVQVFKKHVGQTPTHYRRLFMAK